MRDNVKVSVIIPIYNSEKYLVRCLDSIVNQTLKDIEVILINDGSTDNSLDICNEYAKLDPRVIVINSENKGVSQARNQGIYMAKGQYIYFVDSDDYMDIQGLEEMYSIAKENEVDIVICNFYKDNKIVKSSLPPNVKLEYTQLNKALLKCSTDMLLPFPFRSLFKNSEKQRRISFKYTLKYGEDTLYNLKSYFNNVSVFYLDNQFYHYISNTNSVMSTKKDNLLHNLNDLYIEKINLFTNKNLEEHKQDVYDYSLGHMLDLLIDDVYKYDEINHIRNSLKSIRNSEMISDGYKYSNLKNTGDTRVYKLIKLLLKYRLYTALKHLIIIIRLKNKNTINI
ncbi:MAG: glycosyltransferase family 2 protein [Terrisporobacter othiniensis]|uniref:glycosyltransferase family 2 protein n=1 Tax=Terrisporobacter othiniensis TaxID=1577792 RepID=UPI0006923D1F|nr:glycosyltransferase family 2 protein [Terrisporobacter othiniensis]MDY3373018.1 glycosyltransferase family 2 protein [Terrisporobacter othiniensis]